MIDGGIDGGATTMVEQEEINSYVEHRGRSNECDGRSIKKPRFDPPTLTTSFITDYFHQTPKMSRKEETIKELSLEEEEEWFTGWTKEYRGTGGEDTTTPTTKEPPVEQQGYLDLGGADKYPSLLHQGAIRKNTGMQLGEEQSPEPLVLSTPIQLEHSAEQYGYREPGGAATLPSLISQGAMPSASVNEQPPEPLGSREDDIKGNKDDLEDWMESGSDQDDLVDVLEAYLSQGDKSIRSPRQPADFLTSGRQEKDREYKVPDIEPSPVTPIQEADEKTLVGS